MTLSKHAITTTIPSLTAPAIPPEHHNAIVRAGQALLPALLRGQSITSDMLRTAMTDEYGGSDAEGLWVWKSAYDACEAAQVLFLRRFLPGMKRSAKTPSDLLSMLERFAALFPTHTRRSEESQGLQQFSTPLPLAMLVAEAAAITSDDLVLEPSAGTGLLAIHAEAAGAALHLNELGASRAGMLADLFPDVQVTHFNAEHIHDLMDDRFAPSVVIMNPPFSASPNVSGTMAGVDMRHIRSALARLAPGGRLVAITSEGLSPFNQDYAKAFQQVAETATLQFTAALDGKHFQRHGTTIPTRLSVFDKLPAPPGHRPITAAVNTPLTIMVANLRHALPGRSPVQSVRSSPRKRVIAPAIIPVLQSHVVAPTPEPEGVEIYYSVIEAAPTVQMGEALYEPYSPERIRFEGAKPHPDKLVQSAAMASVRPPVPTYKPHLPQAVVDQGLLSDAQLESVVYAGEAHSSHLAGTWKINETLDALSAAAADAEGGVKFRRGWFLGDGTGAGKGRQVAGIILDNRLKGRTRAIWISKSDKLLEDAQRDWQALGQERLKIVPLDRYKQGTPIKLRDGILFTTYATLRSPEREGKRSRLQQIMDWAGPDFDGVIIFDEAHAMANAAGGSSERGDRTPSQQGLSGLRLQHGLPDARVVYVSATGATTVENLAYAQRLGLWGSDDLPFATRTDFVAAMMMGGIASAEVLARDLKTLGLYAARSLSYEGVEVDILEHELTSEQVRIYDAYAAAYQLIHQNLDEALKASNISSDEGTLNKVAKSAARSAFESNKQRFFNHLITAMKMPSLIAAVKADVEDGKAAVVQLVSTSEALMERRLSQVPAGEWGDLSFDVTPREYVLDYLMHGFPTALYEVYTDPEGNLQSRPMLVDGRIVESREAVARRDNMIQQLAALPPVQAALDQLIHHFGTDMVAEVTGRSRRIVKQAGPNGFKLAVQNRPGKANLAETQAFMDDKKRILVFSDAGGTGRSYHADLDSLNHRPRVHYLLEAGWKADAAIQGLGRTNRTNQAQPPLFRPVATNVRGEKRFLSTIARRLDSLGAITRGQRQTGGQGMFRASDNLESTYARAALRQFYRHIHKDLVACCPLQEFERVTGLSLTDNDLTLREELPPISTFLNRILALQIDLQNQLFTYFEQLISSHIESALAAGTFEVGLETIQAESLLILQRTTLECHQASGAATELVEVARKDRNQPVTLESVKRVAAEPGSLLLHNGKSGRVALAVPAPSITLEDGSVEKRIRIIRPMERNTIPAATLEDSYWERTNDRVFEEQWKQELQSLPTHTTTIFHIMSGLLLPLWKRLPYDNPRIYRFQTDSGERVIGRLVLPEHLHTFDRPETQLDAGQVWQRLQARGTVSLTDEMTLKPVTSMHAQRIELVGFHDSDVERLKAMGCMPEIIAWKLRLFVPVSETGRNTVEQLLARYGNRTAAAA